VSVKRGRVKYIPLSLLDELEDLKMEKRLRRDVEAFEEIANYSQVGREAERLAKFDFHHKVRRKSR
jgi:hypothetical protein